MAHNSSELTSTKHMKWLAWFLFVLAAAIGLLSIILFVLNRNTFIPATWGSNEGLRTDAISILNILLQTLVQPLTASIFGLLIVTRRPHHRIGWLLCITGVFSAMLPLFSELTIYLNFTLDQQTTLGDMVAWIRNWMWVAWFVLIIFNIALFPTGHFFSRRWAWIISMLLILFAVPLFMAAALEKTMTSAFQISNPFVASNNDNLYNGLISFGVPWIPLAIFAVLLEVRQRHRQADLIQKQQIKWLMASLAVMVVVVVSAGLILSLGYELRVGAILLNNVNLLPLLGIGIGILRYRLYDIDIIIRRTLVYGLLSAILILIYFGSVTFFSSVFTAVTGQESPLAIVISTLLIAALFSPMRRRTQATIDRRFYRRRYDAAQTLAAFAQTARAETDLDELTAELSRVVEETMQPERLGVWLLSGTEGGS